MATRLRILCIPCAHAEAAESFAERLRVAEGLDSIGVDGCDVLIPTSGDPGFVWDVATLSGGYAHDDEAARAVTAFLGGTDG